ncbi:hypothetical protein BZU93_28665, partial [Salmonella enterica subsp. enterica]|nr:hypothetical protein [Salmonella enterica subsp. enterica serovar Enteritidis]
RVGDKDGGDAMAVEIKRSDCGHSMYPIQTGFSPLQIRRIVDEGISGPKIFRVEADYASELVVSALDQPRQHQMTGRKFDDVELLIKGVECPALKFHELHQRFEVSWLLDEVREKVRFSSFADHTF